MKKFREPISMLLAFLMLFSVFAFASFTSTSASTVTPLGCVKQNDAKWKDYYYGEGNLYDTGCGIFSLVNAVGYLTGKRMSVTDVASWAHSINAFNVTGSEGTYRTVLYPNVEEKYGDTYGFTVDCSTGTGYWEGSDSTTLKNHLNGGGVAVGHVPNHFIAIVGYDSIENKFHVYDSYATNARGTNTNGGDVWVTQSQLASGQLCLDWFCLLSLKDSFSSDYSIGVYETTTDLNIRATASASGTLVDTIPMGTPIFVTFVTESGWGYTSYNGSLGYVNLKYAQYTGELPASAECTVGIYINKTDLNLRTSSSYKSNSLTVIPANTTLHVTKVSSGWGYTEYNGYIGWFNLSYAEYVSSYPTSAETNDTTELTSETETNATSTQTTEPSEETT
ncbi:MAG: hypothetical protein J1E41_02115, partial [Ruminococcus sp.]|nr:hypothetical protein [Ruminococcus sp.]